MIIYIHTMVMMMMMMMMNHWNYKSLSATPHLPLQETPSIAMSLCANFGIGLIKP